MPGTDDRTPSDADRPPASRVADELDQRATEATKDGHEPDEAEIQEIEQDAMDAAREKQWDQASTRREGSEAS